MQQIVPIILAAGDSARMGYPKALLPLGRETFLTHILSTLASLELAEAIVVLGSHEALIRPLLVNHRVRTYTNPDPARGQMSSLHLAAENLPAGYQGGLIWPVDQPLISAELVAALVNLFSCSAAPLVLPRCNGKPGHPAIFGRTLIEELLAVPPGQTPKTIVSRHRPDAAWLATAETGTIEDIDTPEDYFRCTGVTLESALADCSTAEEQ